MLESDSKYNKWKKTSDAIIFLFGTSESHPLEQRLMISAFLIGIFVALVTFAVHIILRLNPILTVISVAATLFFAFSYYYCRFKNNYQAMIVPYTVLCLLVFTVTWFYNSGYDGPLSILMLNAFIVNVIIARKKNKIKILFIYLAYIALLHYIYFYYPGWVSHYDSQPERFNDIIITVLYNFVIAYAVVSFVVRNYHSEKARVEKEKQQVLQLNNELEKLNLVLTNRNETIVNQNMELEQLNEALRESNSKIKDALLELEQINDELNQNRIILEEKKTQSDKLLLNVLPAKIAERLKNGEEYIAERFDEVSIVFIDIVNFTQISSGIEPEMIVEFLNDLFTRFDKISEKFGLEKIKTIGDSYMAVSGIPLPRGDNAEAAALMAIDVMEEFKNYNSLSGQSVMLRIGIDCGPVVAGVIGEKKFIYDLWGDAVNTASRMEQYGTPGQIQITGRFRSRLLKGHESEHNGNNNGGNHARTWLTSKRGEIEIKGKGVMQTYFLHGCLDHEETMI